MAVIAWDGAYPVIDSYSVRVLADIVRADIHTRPCKPLRSYYDELAEAELENDFYERLEQVVNDVLGAKWDTQKEWVPWMRL